MPQLEMLSAPDPTTTVEGIVREVMQESVRARGRFLMVLAGGSTPLSLYRRLAKTSGELPWRQAHLFWGDERFVPTDHHDSNYRAAREVLSDRVPVPQDQVHPWPILSSPEASARAYAARIREEAGDLPIFDLVLLGLGADCHTASLFPGTGAERVEGLTVTSVPTAVGAPRLSLTTSALSRSRTVLFLVTGEEKREALTTLLADEGDCGDCPARAIRALERLLVVTDLPASRR